MNASAININATTVRYDQLSELADLLINYTGKREEIETLLNSNDPFAERTNQIAGISVSGEAVQIGLQAELTAMELKLQNRFNIIVGRPLPKAVAVPAGEIEPYNNVDDENAEP
jgi:hypothetical protein